MSLLTLFLSRYWKYLAMVTAALALVGAWQWREHVVDKGGYDRAVSERADQDLTKVVKRVADNAVLSSLQTGYNVQITKEKDEKLAPVLKHIDDTRVLVGTAICTDRGSGQATPQSAASGNSADTGSRVVREDADRDLRTLMKEVEQHLATGRACQAFLVKNGLVP